MTLNTQAIYKIKKKKKEEEEEEKKRNQQSLPQQGDHNARQYPFNTAIRQRTEQHINIWKKHRNEEQAKGHTTNTITSVLERSVVNM